MSEDRSTAVIFQGEPAPVTPRATVFDWLKYYAFNLARKPMVLKKQRRLLAVAQEIQDALAADLYPHLLSKREQCPECLDAYMALKPQIFVSQIEFGLKHLQCSFHFEVFADFIKANEARFRESDTLAAWINGFSK